MSENREVKLLPKGRLATNRVTPTQIVPTGSDHSGQSQLLVTGPINVSRQSKVKKQSQHPLHGVQSWAARDRPKNKSGNKIQHISEGSMKETRYLQGRREVHTASRARTGNKHTLDIAQPRTGCPELGLSEDPGPMGQGCGWMPQVSLIGAIKAY